MRDAERIDFAAAAQSGIFGEDRLTELLAVALRLDQHFARLLISQAEPGASAPSGPVHVETQVATPVGRIDMTLRGTEGNHRCWLEMKLDAPFQPAQLIRYSSLGWGKGLVIAPRGYEVPDGAGEWRSLTWAWIGSCLERLLSESSPGDWRLLDGWSAASAVDLARLTFLNELQRRGLMEPRAVTADEAAQLGVARRLASEVIPQILKDIETGAGLPLRESRTDGVRDARAVGWVSFVAPEACWVSDLDAWFEALIAPNERGAGTLFTGFSFWLPRGAEGEDRTDHLMRRLHSIGDLVLAPAGFEEEVVAVRLHRWMKARPLGELSGATLAEQAADAVAEMRLTIEQLTTMQGQWEQTHSG